MLLRSVVEIRVWLRDGRETFELFVVWSSDGRNPILGANAIMENGRADRVAAVANGGIPMSFYC